MSAPCTTVVKPVSIAMRLINNRKQIQNQTIGLHTEQSLHSWGLGARAAENLLTQCEG